MSAVGPADAQNLLGSKRRCLLYSAVSAIDIALWDIKSKALNVPLYKLLESGGIRCAAMPHSCSWMGANNSPAVTVQDYVDRARLALQDGYDAIRLISLTGMKRQYIE
ncbi:MAG: hypothetical protein ACLTMD_05455 [Clostridium sp.]